MAFPHQQSRKDHERKEDKPGGACVQWKLFERTVDISVYRNAEDDVNPAKNRTGGDICSHSQNLLFDADIIRARRQLVPGYR